MSDPTFWTDENRLSNAAELTGERVLEVMEDIAAHGREIVRLQAEREQLSEALLSGGAIINLVTHPYQGAKELVQGVKRLRGFSRAIERERARRESTEAVLTLYKPYGHYKFIKDFFLKHPDYEQADVADDPVAQV